MVIPKCRVCESHRTVEYARGGDPGQRAEEPKDAFVHCLECGFRFRVPTPAPPREVKSADATPHRDAQKKLALRADEEALDGLATFTSGRRILDIGCGEGHFLEAAVKRGYGCIGLEVSAERATRAASRALCDVRAGELTKQSFPDGYFDVVNVDQFLLYVADPHELFFEIARILKPFGLLRVREYDADSLVSMLNGRKYWLYLAPVANLWTSKALRLVAESKGLELIQTFRGTEATVERWLEQSPKHTPLSALRTRAKYFFRKVAIGRLAVGADTVFYFRKEGRVLKCFEFPAAAVQKLSEEWVVVNKPAGMVCQSRDEGLPEDLPFRLKAWLREQGKDDYLGVHQRLDLETSGLLFYTRKKELNAKVAQDFETHRAKKMYVACVSSYNKKGDYTAEHYLRADRDGTVRPIARGRPDELARTTIRLIRREGSRALLSLELHTGKTHQARAQLAALGMPIVGDARYQGAPGPRLMLHSKSLTLPSLKLSFDSEIPSEFSLWVARGDLGVGIYDVPAMVSHALETAVHKRFGLFASGGARRTNAFRLVNAEGDGLPNLVVDLYDGHAVIQFYEDGEIFSDARRKTIVEAVSALGVGGIYLKNRPKHASVIVDSRKEEIAPKGVAWGAAREEEFSILEEGISFRVRLNDGLSTGIFLDQRHNRKRLREIATGKRVLNLFAYTCPFSVAAAAGKAKEITSVDISAGSLEWGKRQVDAVRGAKHGADRFIAEDVFDFLERTKKGKDRYDIVILDPPSFSTSKRHRFSLTDDLGKLVALAAACVKPKGILFVSTNHRKLSNSAFRALVFKGLRLASRESESVRDGTLGVDFPPLATGPHLKSAWIQMA